MFEKLMVHYNPDIDLVSDKDVPHAVFGSIEKGRVISESVL